MPAQSFHPHRPVQMMLAREVQFAYVWAWSRPESFRKERVVGPMPAPSEQWQCLTEGTKQLIRQQTWAGDAWVQQGLSRCYAQWMRLVEFEFEDLTGTTLRDRGCRSRRARRPRLVRTKLASLRRHTPEGGPRMAGLVRQLLHEGSQLAECGRLLVFLLFCRLLVAACAFDLMLCGGWACWCPRQVGPYADWLKLLLSVTVSMENSILVFTDSVQKLVNKGKGERRR